MDAKTIITNLIEAIETIRPVGTADAALIRQVEDAQETAGLAKLMLPSLDAPAPAPAHIVIVHDHDASSDIGPFANDIEAQTYIDAMGLNAAIVDVHPPAAVGGPVPTQAPNPGAAASAAPDQSYDEVLDDLKAANQRPGSVIANKPPGSLYKH